MGYVHAGLLKRPLKSQLLDVTMAHFHTELATKHFVDPPNRDGAPVILRATACASMEGVPPCRRV